MSELPLQVLPKLCECILLEATTKIREALARIDSFVLKGSAIEAQREIKKTLVALELNYQEHIVDYNKKYARNMTEYAKTRALNIGDPLQTNGHTNGDIRRLREPPKKKHKKDKKAPLDGSIATSTK